MLIPTLSLKIVVFSGVNIRFPTRNIRKEQSPATAQPGPNLTQPREEANARLDPINKQSNLGGIKKITFPALRYHRGKRRRESAAPTPLRITVGRKRVGMK
jgi:hypothetical protein